jgi:hypothetical protein
MKIRTQLAMLTDALAACDVASLDQHLANLNDCVELNERLVHAVLINHDSTHTFGADLCHSATCQLAAASL